MNTLKTSANTVADDDEMLSALMDNALSADEVQQVLACLHTAPRGVQHERARRLERYALLGDLMRTEADSSRFSALASHPKSRNLAAAVMQQIATEVIQPQSSRSVHNAHKSSFGQGWLAGWRAPAFSMAMAASVAVVMLVVVQDAGINQGESNFSAARNAPELSAQSVILPDLTEPAPSLAALEASLDALPDAYLLQHLAHAEGGSMRNLSSNVRLASYERP